MLSRDFSLLSISYIEFYLDRNRVFKDLDLLNRSSVSIIVPEGDKGSSSSVLLK